MKAASGKFAPVNQWLYFDAEEALPGNGATLLPAVDTSPRGSRYDSQASVIGWPLQGKISQLSYLLVGAGAIGCEMLKNWAMMGVTCSLDPPEKLHLPAPNAAPTTGWVRVGKHRRDRPRYHREVQLEPPVPVPAVGRAEGQVGNGRCRYSGNEPSRPCAGGAASPTAPTCSPGRSVPCKRSRRFSRGLVPRLKMCSMISSGNTCTVCATRWITCRHACKLSRHLFGE